MIIECQNSSGKTVSGTEGERKGVGPVFVEMRILLGRTIIP